MILSLIHVVAHSRVSFYLSNIPRMDIPQLVIHSPADGTWGGFQARVTVNKVVIKILAGVFFVDVNFYFSSGNICWIFREVEINEKLPDL